MMLLHELRVVEVANARKAGCSNGGQIGKRDERAPGAESPDGPFRERIRKMIRYPSQGEVRGKPLVRPPLRRRCLQAIKQTL